MPQRVRPEIQLNDGATPQKVELEELFNHGRWKKPYTIKHFLFCLYLPIGLVLWPFKIIFTALLFFIALVGPKSISTKTRHLVKYTMGIRYDLKGAEHIPKKGDPSAARILVCNHLTDFDPYPLYLVLEGYHVLVASHIKNVPVVGKAYEKLNTIYVDQTNKAKAREDVLNSLNKSDLPLLLYPEGGLTNGKAGLMMFQKFVFGLGHSVLPIAMKLENTWPVHVDYINSSWFKNFFWWMLIPYHTFSLEFLPPVSINSNETDSDFASRVQNIIANHLNIEATPYFYSQKKELAKKLLSQRKE
ncbi:hypothetical protein DICPUDRAFT_160307 [Dictyostelium purpureum]|uniref:Phospholipid/glycerol acyltransferase domain-containing protein n=1 Tax=Dictyostelium purpureum TaxID=5786 RepID=F1A643_DICPU|nr:uncharacterized protein DICPUDRAFT_160307 [Dictyostelium purpureum]EGC28339.1 hypothetical protein DICPUDRAFT_160307 [Dictyostelium purpureum]|eukprot:XP_003295137.1 hypothetical protein DICPUDRAFT_160307 [Dictyostelium purpureum]